MTTSTSTRDSALLLHADLDGILSASRNLGAMCALLPTLRSRAIGTLGRRWPVQARRDIQAEYRIGARRLSQDLQARPSEGGVRLIGRFRGIGLRNFGARQTRRGVTATVFRGKRSLRDHAFIGVGVNRNAQVFRREGAKREMKQGRYAGKQRQPLVAEYGATAAQMLAKGRRPERLIDYARGVLDAESRRLMTSASMEKSVM
ncbi:MAG: hypothetical protein KF800_13795 [Lysobacter sp.]|nr:hypothetical protein [Lysobacter sp.]